MFLLLPVARDLALPASPVEGINIGIKNDMVKMPDDDGETGEDGFVIVDGKGHIHGPPWEEASDIHFEPNHQAGNAHNDCAPDDSPVLHLFGVAEPADGS